MIPVSERSGVGNTGKQIPDLPQNAIQSGKKSGKPAVPDELLKSFCLFEELLAWKLPIFKYG